MKKNLQLTKNIRTPVVQNYIRRYKLQNYHLNTLANRSKPYLYFIYQELLLRNMPAELAFLPMIESAYMPFAQSKVGASGIWQINAVTGKHFSINTDQWCDERYDIVIATNTALNYLQYLHNKYNSWLLALAAYNAGPATVNKAIAKNKRLGKPQDYYSLNLPKQTKQFVPKLLAIAYIMTNHNKLKINLPYIANKPYFVAVNLSGQVHLKLAANAAQMDLKKLHSLNPSIKQQVTHPTGPHKLLIPIHKAENFSDKIKHALQEYKASWQAYKIQRGDNLITIAKKFQSKVRLIKYINDIKGSRIVAGKTILVPRLI